MRHALVITLLVVAGCSTPTSPTGPPEPPESTVTLENGATGNQSYTFTDGTVPGLVDAVRETTVSLVARADDRVVAWVGGLRRRRVAHLPLTSRWETAIRG